MSLRFLQTWEVKTISEFQHLLSTLSPECDKRHDMAVEQPSAWATPPFHHQGLFLYDFLSAAA